MPPARLLPLGVALLVGACANLPTGPGVMVLPGTRMSFDQFRADDEACRDYAYRSVGGKPAQDAVTGSAVAGAAVGTAVGAAAGAALGGGEGAAIGAGTGLLIGTAVGTSTASASGHELQVRYDNAYTQCMYARGHRVPAPAGMAASQPPVPRHAPPPETRRDPPPPPPPGLPPAPPPR